MTVLEGNQSCIKVAKNPELHGRSKHIDVRYHFVQKKTERKVIALEYCNTKDMSADIFAKALAKLQFLHLRNMIHMVSKPQ
jgi:hypothetical protein